MDSVVGVISAAAVLLVLAGSQKLIDPWPTATALRQTRLPSSRRLVRVGAAVEILIGALFVVVGTPLLALTVAGAYLGFTGFLVLALVVGVDGSCGCFGREDTPPSWLHVLANLGVAGAAIAYASGAAEAPLDTVADASLTSVALVAATAMLAALLVAVYSLAPRLIAATRLGAP